MEFYKRIVKKRSSRIKILRKLSFLPDSVMIRLQYFIKMGFPLSLKKPRRFTEKLQWYKLYYKNPLMVKCVDKGDVRDFVKEKGLENILVPCYGVFDNPDSISWENLPQKFVMKDTLGGGGTKVVLVEDKLSELERLKRLAKYWTVPVSHNYGGREWPYYCGKKHRVIIEERLDSENPLRGINDYKFFCFNGKVEFLYVMGNRALGKSVCVSIYDRYFNKLPVLRKGDEELKNAEKPECFDEMLAYAEKLSEDFPHVRVDLYNIQGKIYFGEMTFFNASGYMKYDPDSFDLEIGQKWQLPLKQSFSIGK